MLPSLLITFRETLEAALIVGIVLSFLAKTKQTRFNNVVYIGVASAIVVSIICAILFSVLAGGFTGRAEKIFEGVTMIIGALLLTTMILWMMKQKHITKEIEDKVGAEVAESHKFGLFSLVFVAVLREGVETVIFLGATRFASSDNSLIGALIGITTAVALGYAMFVGSMKINLKTFFNITSVLLILFAAGLVAHGVHEFQEAGVIPTMIEHVWDINPAVGTDGKYPLLHEKGHIGSILSGLFGYNGNPSLIELLSWSGYLLLSAFLWRRSGKDTQDATSEGASGPHSIASATMGNESS